MILSPFQLASLVAAILCYAGIVYTLERALTGRALVYFRYIAAASTIGLFFLGVRTYISDRGRAVEVVKVTIAAVAACCVFYEIHRENVRRPIGERWKRFAGVTLAVAAIAAYYNGLRFDAPHYYHAHEHFHYYIGAKYFRELGYSGLYKCAVIAQDELGVVTYPNAVTGREQRIDMSTEVRHPDMKLRNLSGDNLLIPGTAVLEKPEECKKGFSPERWGQFKEDVKFFRITSGKGTWENILKDHGYNPPPVWTIAGHYLAELRPASIRFLQFLAAFDVAYLAGMFAALGWAFGWRVFAVAAIFWGCQGSAPSFWTNGAFLRQDWLFFLVLSACLTRKRYFALAGASMVYAGLLRIFPGLAVIGWLVVFFTYIARHRRIAKSHLRMLLGGVLAAVVLISLSLHVAGKDAYRQFYHHTIEVHDQTPLTNHMGLRVLVGQKTPIEVKTPWLSFGTGQASGRMKYTKDTKLMDPFELWKRMRNERNERLRVVTYGILALSLAFFVYVVRRVKSMWIAQCLGQIWIILLAQLTSYYYVFMILAAPLTKHRRSIEVPLFGLAALTQFIFMTFHWNDDKYYVLTAVSLVFCYGLLCAFAPHRLRERLRGLFGAKGEAPAGGPALPVD